MSRIQRLFVAWLVLVLCLTTWSPLSFTTEAITPVNTVFLYLPADAYDAQAISAVRVWDYDSFLWLEVETSDLNQLDAVSHQVYSQPFTLRLGEISFDTRQGAPLLPAGWESVQRSGPDLHLVQFIGPTRAEWLTHLKDNGLQIVQYIHPFTYVVWGESQLLNRATGADFVHWSGPFAPAYRVLPQWQSLPEHSYQTSVLLYRGADTDAAVRSIQSLGGRLRQRTVLNAVYEIVGFNLPGDQFLSAAQVPGVYSIQVDPTDGGLRGEMSNQVNVNNVDGSNQAFPGYLGWLTSVGLDGAGVIMANVDGGVQNDHPDLVNRLISCTGQTCGGAATSEHGTHTAGIMAADGSSGVIDAYGFMRGLGMAPNANLVEQVYNPWFTQPGGMLLLMTDSYNNGAVLSSNSWGPAGTPQGYDDDTLQVDIGVRDADPAAPGNQPFNYVLSIMNGNGGTSSQGSPDEAKNIFTVGSTKMQTSGGAQILEIDDLSSNSAHGPCLDGRNIPHIVAPGCYVDSTVSGSGHATMCGTSMSSPHVSGAVALFFEYYRNLFGVDPSAALVKAAFLPVAHDLAGHLDADGDVLGHPFDSKQGWGRMDTAAVLSPTLPVLYYDNPLIFDNTGETWQQTLSPADPDQPVRLMLVWTDAPGHGLGGDTPAWNNNLDLIVEFGGDTYYGNDFDANGWSQTGVSADDMHNTEGVFLGPNAPASFTVRVQASNIGSDGIPNQGDDTDQDFALACYNCLTGADFILSAEPDAFEVCAPELVTSSIEVGQVLSYSHNVSLDVLNVPAGVLANIDPTTVTPSGVASLTLDVTDGAAPGSYVVVVSGTAELTNVHTAEIDLLINTNAPDAPALLSPTNGQAGVGTTPVFSWTFVAQANRYLLQVASDPGFGSIVYSATLEQQTTHVLETPLMTNTQYFWRVQASNVCGAGSYSDTFYFHTLTIRCQVYDSTDVPLLIPEGGGASGSTTSDLTVADSGAIYDVNVLNLIGTHTYMGDLDFYLDSPQSTQVHLMEQACGTYEHFDLNLDDQADPGPWPCPPTDGGTYQPTQALAGFVDEDSAGNWTLTIVDNSSEDSGELQSWSLEICVGVESCISPTVSLASDSPVELGQAMHFSASLEAGTLPMTYTWDLGDGSQPVVGMGLDVISHTYAAEDTYTVTLLAENECGEDTTAIEVVVTPAVCDPVSIDALDSDSPVELGQALHFSATVSGEAPISYTWDFGGAGSGSDLDTATPVFTYTSVGLYTVWLTASNSCPSSDAEAREVSVVPATVCTEVSGVELNLLTPGTIYTNTVVEFSAGVLPDDATAPYSYTVDYDGAPPISGSSAVAPWTLTHTFASTGSFDVVIAVWNCEMSTALTDVLQIDVYEPGVCLDLNAISIHGITSSLSGSYTFTTSYEPANASIPIEYVWDNGDVTNRTVRDLPVGEHTLMVTATNCVSAEVSDLHFVTVVEPDIDPALPPEHAPVPPDASYVEVLGINNTGGYTLSWTLGEVEPIAWLTKAYTQGETLPASTFDVNLTFDATGLSDGVYTGTLLIESNDPDEAMVYVPLILTVSTEPVEYTLTTSVDPAGSGSVTLYPAGGDYEAGTLVTLTAEADSADWAFLHWTGDVISGSVNVSETITMNDDYAVTAVFSETAGCVKVDGVELSRVAGGTIRIGDVVDLQADISPNDFSALYTYTVDYGDGTPPITTNNSDDPLDLQHVFAVTGVLTVEISVWNCEMTEAVSDTLDLTVMAPEPGMYYVYLSVVMRNN